MFIGVGTGTRMCWHGTTFEPLEGPILYRMALHGVLVPSERNSHLMHTPKKLEKNMEVGKRVFFEFKNEICRNDPKNRVCGPQGSV